VAPERHGGGGKPGYRAGIRTAALLLKPGGGLSAFAGKEDSIGDFPDDLFQDEPEMALLEIAKGDDPKSSSQEVGERALQVRETEMKTRLQCFFRDDPLAVENQ
jgi:hypothetical protein